MLYSKPSIQTTNVNGAISVVAVTGSTRSVTKNHIKNVKVKIGAADTEKNKGTRSRGGGAGASTA